MQTVSTEESLSTNPVYWQHAAAQRDAVPVTPWTEAECAALLSFNQKVGGGEAVVGNIGLLQDRRALVVIAGQQAGILLTPLYILYKALAAIKWSRQISNLLARPVIPAFWIASEDHDFEEISRANYLGRNGEAHEWQYHLAGDYDGKSAFDYPVETTAFAQVLDQIEQETLPTEFKDAILGYWRRNAAISENLEDFFARGLADLTSVCGLVLIPSRLDPIRKRSIPIFANEIQNPLQTTAIVTQAGESWLQKGVKPPIHRNGQETNFFLYRDRIRCKVQYENGLFHAGHPVSGQLIDQIKPEQLLQELSESPTHFSPNVITRPMVQDSSLPVLAMVAGPGEAQYLSQLNPVYKSLGIYQSIVLRRPRILLVEPRIERLLSKRQVPIKVLQDQDRDVLKGFLARSENNEQMHDLEDFRADLAQKWAVLKVKMGEALQRPSIASAMSKTEESIWNALDKLEQRVRDDLKQQDKAEQSSKIMNSLFPQNAIQERTLGPVAPFLINYGQKFVEFLLHEMKLDETELQVMMLSKISGGK